MHKRYTSLIFILLSLTAGILFATPELKADNVNSWITSGLKLEREADTKSLPSTLNGGNINCIKEDDVTCSVTSQYGVSANGAMQFSGTGFSHPVLSYIDNRPRVTAVPGSGMAVTYTTSPVFGFYLYFNYGFPVILVEDWVNGIFQPAYKMIQPPDGKLVDKSNKLLAADPASISYSPNGKWMVVSVPNVAVIRVNLETFEVLPFAEKFTYGIGLPPELRTAITNDGRYAVVASKNQSRFILYDLNTCGAVPNTITGPVNCQSRDLKSFMVQQVPGYDSVLQARFLSNDQLSLYASYKVDNAFKTARFLASNTNISSQIEYLALGESYISGEGAFNYQAGTDTTDNHCHLSLVSYPYLIGRDLGFNSYHSVACSGAKIKDITNTSIPYGSRPQTSGKEDVVFDDEIYNNFLPGYRAQIEFVVRYRPQAIMVSIGGNDIGFSDIVQRCILSTGPCYSTYEDRLELVRLINNQVFRNLVFTYQSLKAAGATDVRIYVIGYPQIAKPDGDCAVNVRLNNDELTFGQQLIAYLDLVIKKAADKAGVYYVDTQDALDGHRLCEAGPGSVAVNGLTAGTDLVGTPFFSGPIGNESYHPNELGHQLLKNKILAATKNLTEPMPTPNPNAGPPSESGLAILNVARQNRAISNTQYNDDMTDDVLFQGTSSDLKVKGLDYSLTPGNSYRTELQSDPVNLGNFSSDSSGSISAQIQIPNDVPIGFHTLHVYGTNIADENVDIYKDVYVAASEDDFDGDGVDNSSDPCFFIEPSGQDYDQDGIDDACDGTLNQPPPPAEPQSQSEDIPEDTENQNPTIVLSSTTNNGTQPPVSNPVNPSTVDVFSPENDDKKIEANIQSATTTNPSTTADNYSDKFTLGFDNLKPWSVISAASIIAAVAVSLLLKKSFST